MNKTNPLGQTSVYIEHYTPTLLFPVARTESRTPLGIKDKIPFYGEDIWNLYELSWLDEMGKPLAAIGELRIPCDSPNIVESKSLKLYLNSFNQSKFNTLEIVKSTMIHDIANCVGTPVNLQLFLPQEAIKPSFPLHAISIDDQAISPSPYHPHPESLAVQSNAEKIQETLVSHLFKSNCPVTHQPDWASIYIDYAGSPIDQAGLLHYLISYRQHQAFHEACVEQIFLDIQNYCQPHELSVYARFCRRGGIDINPFRSTHHKGGVNFKTFRQ